MNKLAAAAVLVAVMLGLGVFGAERLGQNRLHDAVALFRSRLGPGDSFTYRRARAAWWRSGADFTDARLQRGAMLLTASELRLSHIGDQRVKRAALRDAELRSGGISLHAARLEVRDASARPGGADETAVRIGGASMTGVEARLPAAGGISVRISRVGFNQTPDGGGLGQHSTAEGIEIRDGDGGTLLRVAGWSQASTTRGEVTVSGYRFQGFSAGQEGRLARTLGQLGYRQLSGDGEGTVMFRSKPGLLDFGPATERLDGIGRIESRLVLTGVPVSALPGPTAAQLAQASLTGASLSFEDAGLAARVLRLFASRSGMAPDQFRNVLAAELRQRLAAGPQPMFEQAAEQAAIRFLADPRRFAITLQPPAPLPMAALAALRGQPPDDAVRSLGLGISAD